MILKIARSVIATLVLISVSSACARPLERSSTMQFTGPNQALETAIAANDPSAARAALAAGAQVNARGKYNVTPLIYAVGIKANRVVEVLLGQGADPNQKDQENDSAVSLAIAHYDKDPSLLVMVLDAGGDPNLTGRNNVPVIMHFLTYRNFSGITFLKSRGANLDALVEGSPLIVNTAFAVDWDVVAFLMDSGARLDTPLASEGLVAAFEVPLATLPDSPIYAAKVRVWRRLKELGYNPTPPAEL
jgi:uncharacterized protein